MELLVLRHAKSSWSHANLADFDRPLKPRGIRDAARMGRFIREQQLLPHLVLASSATRVRQTLQHLLPELGFDSAKVTWSQRLYHAEPDVWFDALRLLPPACSRCLIVGHNPGLELLLRLICADLPTPADDKLLPTAALAHLRWQGPPSALTPGCAQLIALQRPRALHCPEP